MKDQSGQQLIEKALPDLREVMHHCHEATKNIEFQPAKAQETMAAALLARIMEVTDSAALLMVHALGIGASELLRVSYESMADLAALTSEEKYYMRMEATDLSEKIKIFENAQKDGQDNPYLKSLSDPANAGDLAALKADLEDLKAEGYQPLSVFQRFQRAQLIHLYRGPYASLSFLIHSNQSEVVNGHVELVDGVYSVTAFASVEKDRAVQLLDGIACVAISSVQYIVSLVGAAGAAAAHLGEAQQALTQLRAHWSV